MARYFIALLPPQSVQNAVNQIKQHFAELYASRKAQNSPPHITLHPPFEWLPEQTPALERCLFDFASNYGSIPVKLSGFAAFPPRVIYVKVLKTPELLILQAELAGYLESRLRITDPISKSRSYKPHLTVAFRDLTRDNFKTAWAEFQHQPFEFEFTVPALTLLLHNGRRWDVSREFCFLSPTLDTPAKIESEKD